MEWSGRPITDMADADIFNIKNMYFQRKIADFVLFLTLRRSMVSRWKARIKFADLDKIQNI